MEEEKNIDLGHPTDRQHEGQGHGDARRKDQLGWMNRRHTRLGKDEANRLCSSAEIRTYDAVEDWKEDTGTGRIAGKFG